MEQKLINESKTYPKELYYGHMIQQYKLYVESAHKISDSRININKFYQAILTSVIALVGLVKLNEVKFNEHLIYIICISSVVLCAFWIISLENYRRLNSAKFKVIHEIEKNLPLNLFAYEWSMLEYGNNGKKYKKISNLEKNLPYLFILVFIVIVILELI